MVDFVSDISDSFMKQSFISYSVFLEKHTFAKSSLSLIPSIDETIVLLLAPT